MKQWLLFSGKIIHTIRDWRINTHPPGAAPLSICFASVDGRRKGKLHLYGIGFLIEPRRIVGGPALWRRRRQKTVIFCASAPRAASGPKPARRMNIHVADRKNHFRIRTDDDLSLLRALFFSLIYKAD
jgi:hypothetical protein